MISWSCCWQRVDTMSSSSVAQLVSTARWMHACMAGWLQRAPHRPRTAAHSRGCTIPQTPCLTRVRTARRILGRCASCGGAVIARQKCVVVACDLGVVHVSVAAPELSPPCVMRQGNPPDHDSDTTHTLIKHARLSVLTHHILIDPYPPSTLVIGCPVLY